jgi:hypothetical protein
MCESGESFGKNRNTDARVDRLRRLVANIDHRIEMLLRRLLKRPNQGMVSIVVFKGIWYAFRDKYTNMSSNVIDEPCPPMEVKR